MVICAHTTFRRRGTVTVELVIALSIPAVAVLPVSYSFLGEQRLARAAYQRAVAMEIVDGETEALVAGEWKAFPVGTLVYTPRAAAMKNLPPGKFTLTVATNRLRLEWRPHRRDEGGPVVREVKVTP
jgi:hypothetical protein